MKRFVMHNGETLKESAARAMAWANVNFGDGLEFYAMPLGREPYPLDVDKILEMGLSEEETEKIFKDEKETVKKRAAEGTATGVDYANFMVCKLMLEGQREEMKEKKENE